MNIIRRILILMLATLMPVAVSAQMVAAVPSVQTAPLLAPDQLDQMLAPIALYPDPLIAQILMASTYPLEIVEAERWQQNPANAGLQGDQLAAALESQPWDPSVKSLVPFPQVLQTLNQNIEWTEQLGNTFMAQQADVMNAIQHLRYEAQRDGSLQSTPQQVVTTQGSDILIQPADPNLVYVPYYNPETIYGTWAYPDYPPYYFSGYSLAAGLGFALGIAVIAPLWDWYHWDWRGHRIDIDGARYATLNEGRPPSHPGFWQYDPAHRHGVPYANSAVRARFAAAGVNHAEPNGGNFRGYDESAAGIRSAVRPTVASTYRALQQSEMKGPQFQQQYVRTPASAPRVQPQMLRQAPQVQPVQHAAPVFESFARGQEVRQQQQRGAQSRASTPQPSRAGGNVQTGGNVQNRERH